MIEGEAALAALLIRVFGLEAPPKPLHLIQPAIRAVRGEITLAEAAKFAGTTRPRMERIVELRAIIGGAIPALTPEAERSARQSLGQLLIGNLAERAFEQIYESTVGTTELELRDDRGRRGETDYLVFNGQGRSETCSSSERMRCECERLRETIAALSSICISRCLAT